MVVSEKTLPLHPNPLHTIVHRLLKGVKIKMEMGLGTGRDYRNKSNVHCFCWFDSRLPRKKVLLNFCVWCAKYRTNRSKLSAWSKRCPMCSSIKGRKKKGISTMANPRTMSITLTYPYLSGLRIKHISGGKVRPAWWLKAISLHKSKQIARMTIQ